MQRYGVLVLAAGEGSRMGSVKQSLVWQGSSLLRRAAATAAATVSRPEDVVVVLGAHAPVLRSELVGLDVRVCEHAGWHEGMGTSLRAGMAQMPPGVLAGVIVTLCDQPLVDAAALHRLITAFEQASTTPEPAAWPLAVAASYNDTQGVPVLFAKALLADLAAPPDGSDKQSGAKALLRRHAARVLSVAMPEAGLDIDTPADYDRLRLASGAAARR